VFRFTRNGKTTEIGLGGASKVTLAHVRGERTKIADDIAKGLNPRTERRRAEAQRENRRTFAEVAEFVIKRDREHWGASSLRAWKNSLHIDTKRLADINVADIGVEHVESVITPIVERGEHVSPRRTLGRIEAVLDCAIAKRWRRDANVAAWSVFEHIMPKRPNGVDRRHPMLPWRDAPAVFAKMRETDSMPARCLEFIALTAARLTEARAARWSEIDFDAATWTIPNDRMKMRRMTSEPHVVPLSRQAVALLRELHQVRGNTARVFAGRTPRKPITPGAVWQFSERAPRARLRRTAGARLSERGAPTPASTARSPKARWLTRSAGLRRPTTGRQWSSADGR
jgi:integrase